jgi:hypothetical protein
LKVSRTQLTIGVQGIKEPIDFSVDQTQRAGKAVRRKTANGERRVLQKLSAWIQKRNNGPLSRPIDPSEGKAPRHRRNSRGGS